MDAEFGGIGILGIQLVSDVKPDWSYGRMVAQSKSHAMSQFVKIKIIWVRINVSSVKKKHAI